MDSSMMMPILSTLFMSNNHNSIWNIFVVVVINLFFTNANLYKTIKKIKLFTSKHAKFTLKAKITYRNNMMWNTSYPLNFLAVNRDVAKHIFSAKEHHYNINEYPTNDHKEYIMFFDLEHFTKITEDIYVKTETIKSSSSNDKGNDFDYVDLEITLQTPSNNFSKIKAFVDKAIKEYNEERLDSMKEQHIFVFNTIDKESNFPCYIEYPFTTTKTFDNMFYDQKEHITKCINNFIENRDEYLRLGIPYTLGILLHGEAGCGKTSFVKALAHYTKRHVVIIPVNKVKNIDTLKNIFLSTEINYVKIPNSKRLYVFEDADCSAWRNILVKRELLSMYKPEEVEKKDEMLYEVISKFASEDKEEKPKRQLEEKMTLTLSEVLELFDGVIEIDGRMVVMTTNHINVIDPALLRPGRFDLKIEFGKLSKNNIADMFRLWFGRELPPEVLKKTKDRHFTQADLGSIFSSRDKDSIYKTLMHD